MDGLGSIRIGIRRQSGGKVASARLKAVDHQGGVEQMVKSACYREHGVSPAEWGKRRVRYTNALADPMDVRTVSASKNSNLTCYTRNECWPRLQL